MIILFQLFQIGKISAVIPHGVPVYYQFAALYFIIYISSFCLYSYISSFIFDIHPIIMITFY